MGIGKDASTQDHGKEEGEKAKDRRAMYGCPDAVGFHTFLVNGKKLDDLQMQRRGLESKRKDRNDWGGW